MSGGFFVRLYLRTIYEDIDHLYRVSGNSP